tara:strand:+ start:2438 stop:2755 length:318 start_codon:yes stop_codon:yes gene_type:complete
METIRLGTLTLVTSPSIVQNNDETFCIINFSQSEQDKFANFLNIKKAKENITVYVVDQEKDKQLDLKWLTDVVNKSNTVILKSENKFKVLKNSTVLDLEGLLKNE